MGGQGFIPEDTVGGLVEGNEEANRRREENAYEHGSEAPRAGMQGRRRRGMAPGKRLDRPGTTPEHRPGTGGRVNAPPPGRRGED